MIKKTNDKKEDKVFTNDRKTNDKKRIKCSQMIKKDKVFTNDKKG